MLRYQIVMKRNCLSNENLNLIRSIFRAKTAVEAVTLANEKLRYLKKNRRLNWEVRRFLDAVIISAETDAAGY